MALREIDTAITFYKKSVAIDPLFADAYVIMGWCYGILASWQVIDLEEGLAKAADYLNNGISLNPDSLVGHYAKATISFWEKWQLQ